MTIRRIVERYCRNNGGVLLANVTVAWIVGEFYRQQGGPMPLAVRREMRGR